MNIPKEAELVLFILALLVVAVRVFLSIRAYTSRKSIFSGARRVSKVTIIANTGYGVVALLLGLYFLLSYLERGATTLLFEAALLALLAVLIVEAAFKKRT